MKETENNIVDELSELEKVWDTLSPTEKKVVIEFTKREIQHRQNSARVFKLVLLAGAFYIIVAIIYTLLK